jgi:hypothetical protein
MDFHYDLDGEQVLTFEDLREESTFHSKLQFCGRGDDSGSVDNMINIVMVGWSNLDTGILNFGLCSPGICYRMEELPTWEFLIDTGHEGATSQKGGCFVSEQK